MRPPKQTNSSVKSMTTQNAEETVHSEKESKSKDNIAIQNDLD